jgi:chromosomal replication initiator protein
MALPKQEPNSAIPEQEIGRWDRVCRRLRAEVGEDVYSSWFTSLAFENVAADSIRLSVPTRFLRNWIHSHYGSRLRELCSDEFGTPKRIDLSVRTTLSRTPAPVLRPPQTIVDGHRTPATITAIGIREQRQNSSGGSPLDPRFTYETFLVGRSNALAHAAARQLGDAPPGSAARFNPLYIHSAVGLGKTHLLQAIVWAGEQSGRKMLYLTAEKFMYGFVAALKSQSAIAFK